MKTIKTRETAKGIKILDKPANLSQRTKDSIVRTKERAEETRESRHSSPTEYATDASQEKLRGAAVAAVYFLPDPRKKALKNIENFRRHSQEVRRLLPKERSQAAEQAQKNAVRAKEKADSLRKAADNAKKTANDAKAAVKDAKHTLKQVRYEGRQTLREVRQNAGLDRGGSTGRNGFSLKEKMLRFRKPASQASANAQRGGTPQTAAAKPGEAATGGRATMDSRRPSYLSKGVNAPKSAADAAKPAEKAAKGMKATAKGTVKTAKKSVKTAEKSAKAAVKTAKRAAKTAQVTAREAARAARAAQRAARIAAKAAIKATRIAIKVIISTVKLAIKAIKGLIALIAAGGWIAVLIILVICLIALLLFSIFGIFFSSEPDPGSGMTINGVISEINDEYTGQINAIISGNAHDLLDMSGARAAWKQVLAVYTVRTVTDPDNPMEVATMNSEKAAMLRAVFWDMNAISHSLDSFDVEEDVLDDDGLPTGETETVTKTVLRIIVSHKTPDEMAAQYSFNGQQMEWLAELLKPEYHSLWNALLFGITSIGDGSMIEIADTQIGNVGGEVYWRWYGFSERVHWCAIFVSWVAGQAGFIDAGIIPRFSSCAVGIQWFRDRGQWQDSGDYIPRPGDLIFFDWEPDGTADHAGIVERVDGDHVHTIEGNSSDSVRRRTYRLDSDRIFGYGVPVYS